MNTKIITLLSLITLLVSCHSSNSLPIDYLLKEGLVTGGDLLSLELKGSIKAVSFINKFFIDGKEFQNNRSGLINLEFDNSGYLIKKTILDDSETVLFEYFPNYSLGTSFMYEEVSLDNEQGNSTLLLKHDGNIKARYHFVFDNKSSFVLQRTDYSYGVKNNLIKGIMNNARITHIITYTDDVKFDSIKDEEIKYEDEYIYDNSYIRTHTRTFNKNYFITNSYTYDKNGSIVTMEEKGNRNGKNLMRKFRYEYSYDAKGNWILRKKYQVINEKESIEELVERNIIYKQ